ncbi:hypothetical protein N7517_006283 [Penicillium concentricum]|uniref:Uncharacterized protein n=1 Tax=Penicillium concentricum TaxID=293559 RepID=A0A9W9V9Z6_9EURO|nr:uncharacterized protein N7517_006283 [Penicillium concentricum]KAJ5374277.1 hypothetical protein N7517_006283 [Penicillium concentricum]
MALSQSWFPSRLDQGDKVILDKPTLSTWEIGKLVNILTRYILTLKHVFSLNAAMLTIWRALCAFTSKFQIPVLRMPQSYPHPRSNRIHTPRAESIPISHFQSTRKIRLDYYHTSKGLRVAKGQFPKGISHGLYGALRTASVYWDMTRKERRLVRDAFLREFPRWKWDTSLLGLDLPIWSGIRKLVLFKSLIILIIPGALSVKSGSEILILPGPLRNYNWKKDYNGDNSEWKL